MDIQTLTPTTDNPLPADRLRRFLAHRRFALIATVLGGILMLPTLCHGLITDNYWQQMFLLDPAPRPPQWQRLGIARPDSHTLRRAMMESSTGNWSPSRLTAAPCRLLHYGLNRPLSSSAACPFGRTVALAMTQMPEP